MGMTVARRIARRLRRFGGTMIQVAPAVTVLVALSHALDGRAFLIMLGLFTAMATALAALLSHYERTADRSERRRKAVTIAGRRTLRTIH